MRNTHGVKVRIREMPNVLLSEVCTGDIGLNRMTNLVRIKINSRSRAMHARLSYEQM